MAGVNEQLVRETWINVRRDQNPYIGNTWRILADHPTTKAAWIVSGNSNCVFERSHHLSEDAAWAAAAEVTRARLEEIRQLEFDVYFLGVLQRNLEATEHEKESLTSTAARLEAELRELRRGMKE